jgi:hypothetical protein
VEAITFVYRCPEEHVRLVSKWKLPSARQRSPSGADGRPHGIPKSGFLPGSGDLPLLSGLKTRRILFPMFQNKAEHFGEGRGSQRDATVGGAVIEPQLI